MLIIQIFNCLILCAMFVATKQEAAWRQQKENSQTFPGKIPKILGTKVKRSDKPNIIFIITDDQDAELGSLNFMPKTMRYLRDAGATFPNAFTTTPMCCPSRSSMLTGMYVHNHDTYTNNDNCSSPQWRQTHETRNFGTYLTNAGYRTGYFGKYLNEYTGAYIPPGWTEWMGLIRNTRYYNYSINYNGQKIKHEDDYHKDYLTDLIANNSVRFFRESKNIFPNRPVAMVLSMPAPHGPEDAAPQFQHLFSGVGTHRTPSWNFAPNPDKQWLLQYTEKMQPIHKEFTNVLHTKRLQTLQSVDDAVEKIYKELDASDELDNTYVIYTSDHGYHLGQYGLVKGKAMPYEFDIKVPFFIRGPKIQPNIRVSNIVLNLDIAPTLLDIAGVPIPDHMDGSSVFKLFDGPDDNVGSGLRKKRAWRDTFLVERGKLTHRKLKVQEKLEAQYNRLMLTKEQRLEDECKKAEYQPPCKVNQQWECRRNEQGKLRIFKCRHDNIPASGSNKCKCSSFDQRMRLDEKQRQLHFLKHNVNQPDMIQPKFIPGRTRRHVKQTAEVDEDDNFDDDEGLDESNEWTSIQLDQEPFEVPCRQLANETIICEQLVYTDLSLWQMQKESIEQIINHYSNKIKYLQNVRKHLVESKPTPSTETEEVDTTMSQDSSTHTTEMAHADSEIDEEFEGNSEDEADIEDVKVDEDADCVCEEENEDGDYEKFSKHDRSDRKNRKLENLAKRVEKQEEKNQHYKLKKESKFAVKRAPRKHKKAWLVDERTQMTTPAMQRLSNVSRSMTNYEGDDWSRYNSRQDPYCHIDGLECSRMDNEHWKVAPFWTYGPFCFCPNSNNNTYWCLRTINDSHSFLYCEFITGFISFYDMTKDPYQLRNAVHDLSYGLLHQLHDTLEKMKGCKGSRKCNIKYKQDDDEHESWKQERDPDRRRQGTRPNNADHPPSRYSIITLNKKQRNSYRDFL